MARRSFVERLLTPKRVGLDLGLGLHCLGVALIVIAGLLVHYALAILAGILGLGYLGWWFREAKNAVRRAKAARGRELSDADEIRKQANEDRKADDPKDPGVLWGTMLLPSKEATTHFCVVGAVGSGKTLTLRMLMRNQLPLLTAGSDRRAVIYDPKQDMVTIVGSILRETKTDCPVVILNPFDKRCAAWSIARDVQSAAAARQLADTLVPAGEHESQPFFSNAVRELLAAVVTVFVRTRPGEWTLRDVLLVMRSKALLRAHLEPHPFTRHVVESFLDVGEVTVGSILATVATKLGPFELIAASWAKAKRSFSIHDWLRTNAIVILGNDERMRETIDTVNQLFVALAAQQVLTMEEDDIRRTWFFFDEFSEAGKLRGLESIILRGRSKGCCVVLGFQDISHVHAVYEKELGDTIVGQCGNKAFLRIESPDTADWASRSFGDFEQSEVNFSTTAAADGTTSRTVAEQRQARASILPSEFMQLKTYNKKAGLEAFYLTRRYGAFKASYTYQQVQANIGTLDKRISAVDIADDQWQYLEPWTDADAKRLGLPDEKPKDAPAASHSAGLDEIGRMTF